MIVCAPAWFAWLVCLLRLPASFACSVCLPACVFACLRFLEPDCSTPPRGGLWNGGGLSFARLPTKLLHFPFACVALCQGLCK
jgi:hypothetical protein